MFERITETAARWLWQESSDDTRRRTRWRTLARYGYVSLRDVARGDLTYRASSLAYTTLLSMVPLLAVSFSLFKAFGIHNELEPALRAALAPIGERAGEIADTIIGFVDNMKVGALGAAGVVMLLYTVVSTMQKIEHALNSIWRVAEQRGPKQRFSDYLSVLLVGPVLIFAALGITGLAADNAIVRTLAAYEPFGTALEWLSRLVPYTMIIAAFTFVYVFMPNTRVRVRSAFVGALVAGILWQSTGWAFATFVAGSSQHAAVYSAFAGLVLFVIWVYVAWLILLVGAAIAFYHQHPEYLRLRRHDPGIGPREREALALMIMERVASQQYGGQPAMTLDAVVRAVMVPAPHVKTTLLALEAAGLLARTAGGTAAYLPARPLDAMTVADVIAAARADPESAVVGSQLARFPAVGALMSLADGAVRQALSQPFASVLRDRVSPAAA